MNKDLISLLKARKASRAFSSQPLNEEIISRLMNAIQLSASCFNNQPWRYIFLTDNDLLEKARKALTPGNSWALKAPLLVIGYSRREFDCQIKDGRDYYLFDLGMATQLLLLQATELNLVARPMAGYSVSELRQGLEIPDIYDIYIVVAVGYEGDVNELNEKDKQRSLADRTRNPLEVNFTLNTVKWP
ncbi:nitroreductase family protein [candidate division KSB1 bacterium]|nr:nitroreductase family protein [candidate division KSB1 bacterium]